MVMSPHDESSMHCDNEKFLSTRCESFERHAKAGYMYDTTRSAGQIVGSQIRIQIGVGHRGRLARARLQGRRSEAVQFRSGGGK